MTSRDVTHGFIWGSVHPDTPLLSDLTTLEVGGRPRLYARVCTEDEARAVSRWALEHNLPLWTIGEGSNIVCDDAELEGVALQLELRELKWSEVTSHHELDAEPHVEPHIITPTTTPATTPNTTPIVAVTASAGVVWDDLVREAVQRDLAGVECLSGIPGWVGAAPVQNIGAYGQELSDTCVAVRVYDRHLDETRWWSAEECEFSYRHSVFKANPERYLIFAVKLHLVAHGAPTVTYRQLADHLEPSCQGEEATQKRGDYTLQRVSDAVRELRASKSMLWRESDPNRRSVGSFFTNPIVDAARVAWLRERALELGEEAPPLWEVSQSREDSTESSTREESDTRFKIPAAWLIERSGLSRGSGRGSVGLSSAHTLAIINRGGASAADVWSWAGEVRAAVWQTWRVWLEPEARYVGSRSGESAPALIRDHAPHIALVTCRELPEWEVDDHPLWRELSARGLRLSHPAWDDPDFDWASCDLVIPRTTWDYQERWSEFLAWLRRVSRESSLLNPIELIEWNLDKCYLRDLDVPQPSTAWIERRVMDSDEMIAQAVEEVRAHCLERGWSRAFLKPNIAASAVGTLRFTLESANDLTLLESHLKRWLPERSLILQPYLEQVERGGELSLIYFNGMYSHAVRKIPVAGDYRVQDDYGATDEPWSPPAEWRALCEELVRGLDHLPLYARCDFLTSSSGDPQLIELELIEPSLFFRHDARSPARLADAILSRLDQSEPS